MKAVDKASSPVANDVRIVLAAARSYTRAGQCDLARAFRRRARVLWTWHRRIEREFSRQVRDIEPFPGSCELGECEKRELHWQEGR